MPQGTSTFNPMGGQSFQDWATQMGNRRDFGLAQQSISPFFDPANVDKYFNTAAGNLSATQETTANKARSGAASLAYGRGMLNPSGFTTNAGSGVYNAFAPQFGQLEAGRAGAQMANQKQMYEAIFQKLQTDRQYGLQQKQLNNQDAGIWDYLGAFLPSIPGLYNMFSGKGTK